MRRPIFEKLEILAERRTIRLTRSRLLALIAAEVAAGLAGAGLVASAGSSAAYIDPGLPAMLIQGLIGAFFGAMFFFRSAREKVIRLVARLRGLPEPAPRPRIEPPASDEQ